jgi:hypothetical protein
MRARAPYLTGNYSQRRVLIYVAPRTIYASSTARLRPSHGTWRLRQNVLDAAISARRDLLEEITDLAKDADVVQSRSLEGEHTKCRADMSPPASSRAQAECPVKGA